MIKFFDLHCDTIEDVIAEGTDFDSYITISPDL